jgi:hypothetical protein
MKKTPTQEQIEALASYAAKNGNTWKSKLMESWAKGSNTDPLLQQVRNQLGPSWLASFTIKK